MEYQVFVDITISCPIMVEAESEYKARQKASMLVGWSPYSFINKGSFTYVNHEVTDSIKVDH